jgi:hypothetical protein
MDGRKVNLMSDRNHNRGMHAVRIPAAHDGVGKALRGAYADTSRTLPADMASLLDKIF